MKKYATNYAAGTTVGMDLGDKFHYLCVLDAAGEVVDRLRIPANVTHLERFFAHQQPLLVAMEAGTQSPHISRRLKEWGHEVLVGNPRKLRLIYRNDRKSDERDAEMLARLARSDAKLLHPIHHRGAQAQAHLSLIKSRERLVQARTSLVNHVRGMVKSVGLRLPKCSADAFHKKAAEHIPDLLAPALVPLLETIGKLTEQIRDFDHKIKVISKEFYPETETLQTVRGVGPLTALCFVLILEEASRFRRSRDVPVYLGLVPKRDQSGNCDKQLRISKCGDRYLRQLLVSCAHYILGPFGGESELRDWGLQLMQRGGKNGKKRAVVAVARKLAVLLHSMWVSGEEYEPFRNHPEKKTEVA